MLTILTIAALTLYVSQYVSLYTDDGILSISISYCGFQRDLEKVWSLTKAAYEWTIELTQVLYGLFQEFVIPMLPVSSKDESVETSEVETVYTSDEDYEEDIIDDEFKELAGEEVFNRLFDKQTAYNGGAEEQPEAI